MKKFILLLVCTAFFAMPTFAFAPLAPSTGEPQHKVTFNFSDRPIAFEHTPFLLGDQLMVPAVEFMEQIKTQLYRVEEKQILASYKDNTFIKYTEGDASAYLNGSEKHLAVIPFKHKDVLYIPFQEAAEAFGIHYRFDADESTVYADFRDAVSAYRVYNNENYKSVPLHDLGISFFIPSSWDKLSSSVHQYGLKNDYQDHHIELTTLSLDGGYTRAMLFSRMKNALEQEAIQVKEVRTYKPGDVVIDAMHYTTEGRAYTDHLIYVILEGDIGYIFSGHFNASEADLKQTFDTVASTFQINRMSINTSQEHYVELEPFYKNGLSMKTALYSNMLVENELSLSGSVENAQIKGLKVGVERLGERFDYYLPVKDGQFKATVYIPFGIGKHNLTLAIDAESDVQAPDNTYTNDQKVDVAVKRLHALSEYVDDAIKPSFSADDPNVALKFSVVNTASTPIKDILPSRHIDYDKPDVYATSNGLTYNLSSEYAKAKAIYTWIYESYAHIDYNEDEGIASMEALVKRRSGNALELSALNVGLLRSLDIPSRIVRGENASETAFWVETYINGKWLISDVVKEIENKDGALRFFNVNRAEHYAQFETTDILPF